MAVTELLIGILAVWRVTHLLQAEDGPWDLSLRLRRAARLEVLSKLLDCFYCLSLWVAAPVAAMLAGNWRIGILLWLALSGGAIVVQRLSPGEAIWKEDS